MGIGKIISTSPQTSPPRVIFFGILYDIGHIREEFEIRRKIIDILFMVIIFVVALFLHFVIYKKDPRLEKKGNKILYWAVTLLFMNPFMIYGMFLAFDRMT